LQASGPLELRALIVSSTVIDILLKVAERNGGKILGIVTDKATRLRDAISVNFSSYFESSIDRCSKVTTLFDRSKPVDLLSIYVQTKLQYSQHEITDKQFRDQITKLTAGDSIRIFLITGSAGTGKTFLMRWLFLNLLETADSRIPLYVELRGINHQTDINLLKFLFESLVTSRAHITLETFRSGLNDGEYIFILDGLDEVQPEKRISLSRQIMELQTTYRGIISVVSSRPDEGLASWVLSRKYMVLPLDKKGATALIRKLPYVQSVKRKFSQEVETVLYDRHRSFLSNPLLINVMLLTYGDSTDVPKKMHLFYEQAYETLFYRHDSWKETGFQRKHFSPILIDEFKRVLSAFCISSYKKSRFTFTKSDALELIKAAAEFERIDLKAEDFLGDTVESICILQLDGFNYTFTHRSFQEFFAAVFISRGPPIELGNLLDALASRRGDIVLRMAMDMNPSLMEREWILPRLGVLSSRAPIGAAEALTVATQIFGDLIFDGSRDSPTIEMKLDPPAGSAQILYALSDLFPDDIQVPFDIFKFTDEDRRKVEALVISNFDRWRDRYESVRYDMVEDLRDYRRIEAARARFNSKLVDATSERNVEKSVVKERKKELNKQIKEFRDSKTNIAAKNITAHRKSQLESLDIDENILQNELKELGSEENKIEEKWAIQESEFRADAAVIESDIRTFEKARGRTYESITHALYETGDIAPPSSGQRLPSTNDFLSMYRIEFWRLARAVEIDLIDALAYEASIELCLQEVRKGMQLRKKLDPRIDGEWFSITSVAEHFTSLARSLTKLHKNMASSIDQSKKLGTKLLD
jgi:hypothetical protein